MESRADTYLMLNLESKPGYNVETLSGEKLKKSGSMSQVSKIGCWENSDMLIFVAVRH